MSGPRCVRECNNRGFAYAGTQYSRWCFCGNAYGQSGAANNCDMRCSGNATEVCGGAWANTVYATGRRPPQPPPATVPSLGCYQDQGDPSGTSGRDLNGFSMQSNSMTGAQCVRECGGRGFAYAGTQYGSWCFCGNSYGRSGGSTNCNMQCSGSPSEICGGGWANTVYPTGRTPPPAPTGQYMGCYRDQGDPTGTGGRDLNGYAVQQGNMTSARCTEECTQRGYTYAGTQYGSWCFCGQSYGRSGPADNCNMQCSGSSGEVCGGTWANSVYRVR